VLLAVAAAVTYRPHNPNVGHATTLVLAALIGVYALNLATGVPFLSDGPEAVDLVGLVTKSVEAVGLAFAIRLTPTNGGRRSLAQQGGSP
jgi:hypothetical protein